MTLSMAWVRNVGDVQELVMATDSRLRAPFTWDCCPKMLLLARNDCAVCFAGTTYLAYPMMLQMQHALRFHPKYLSRAFDLHQFKTFLLEVINGMRQYMRELPSRRDEVGEDETFFVLAGYSWRYGRFAIWTLHFDKTIDAFTFRPASAWAGVDAYRLTAIVGDEVGEAKGRLTELLRDAGKLKDGGLDMEPLAVLRDMIRSDSFSSIGGPPQVVKVYRYMNCSPFGVYWPNRGAGQISVLGRPLLQYEQPNCGVLDPDTFEVIEGAKARTA